jgi:hypothetical protein
MDITRELPGPSAEGRDTSQFWTNASSSYVDRAVLASRGGFAAPGSTGRRFIELSEND